MSAFIIAGNWKMHGGAQVITRRLEALLNAEVDAVAQLVLFPPTPYLAQVQEACQSSNIQWGGQDCHQEQQGAYTGSTSAEMLKEFGCHYALVGHSERRHGLGESSELVAHKMLAAHQAGLTPMVCIGETQAAFEAGQTEQMLTEQLAPLLGCPEVLVKAVIAYEPVWAIGTGLVATPEQVQQAHAFIRAQLGNQQPILYGGSVKPNNAADILSLPDVNGVLVGGASLDAEAFLAVANAV